MRQRLTRATWAVSTVFLVLTLAVPKAWNQPAERHCEKVTCLPCAILCKYEGVLDQTHVDVGAIRDGVVVHYHTKNPIQIVDLQRFAYERQKLHSDLGDTKTLAQFCAECLRMTERIKSARFEVANSAHGVFTVLTSDEEEIVQVLHGMAAEMALSEDVHGS